MKPRGTSTTKGLVGVVTHDLLGILLCGLGEVVSSVSDHASKVFLRFVVEVNIVGFAGFNLVARNVVNDTAHELEITRTPVNGPLCDPVEIVVLVKGLRGRQTEPGPYVSGTDIAPEGHVKMDQFGAAGGMQSGLAGGIRGRRHQPKHDVRNVAHGVSQDLGGVGVLFSRSSRILRESIKLAATQSLESLSLGLNSGKRQLDASFGALRLRVEIQGEPNGDQRKDDADDTGYYADYFESGHGGGVISSPNVRAMATPLAGANVERGVEVVVTWKHREQRG